METPVAFFLFNRPETTARVFSQIRRAAPSRLFLVADGPREDRPADAEQCAAARRMVDRIDWPCRVHTNFVPYNMGCTQRMATGINWVFEQVDEAIILQVLRSTAQAIPGRAAGHANRRIQHSVGSTHESVQLLFLAVCDELGVGDLAESLESL
jgi:hypothetical protein